MKSTRGQPHSNESESVQENLPQIDAILIHEVGNLLSFR